MAQAKGSTLIATMDFVKSEKGLDVLEAIMNRLPEGDRKAIETCSPVETTTSSSRLSGFGDTSLASEISRLVSPLIAETTTTN